MRKHVNRYGDVDFLLFRPIFQFFAFAANVAFKNVEAVSQRQAFQVGLLCFMPTSPCFRALTLSLDGQSVVEKHLFVRTS